MTRQAALRRTLNLIILGLTAWLLLTALYVSVGRLLVPVVADYREQLVERVERSTGRAITLDGLTGEMQGAQPAFALRGLTIHESADANSPVLFALDHVVARIDLFASLWRRQLVMDALQVEGLSLEVIQQPDGRWALQGLGRREARPIALQEVAETLLRQRRITLLDSQIRIRPNGLPPWSFSNGELTLLNGRDWHRLDGRLSLPDGERVLWQLNGASRGAGTPLRELSMGFFVQLPTGDWSQWLPEAWLERARLNHFTAGGRVWGSWDAGRLQRLQGEVSAPLIETTGLSGTSPAIRSLSARFAATFADDAQQIAIERLRFRLGEQAWPAARLQGARSSETGQWSLAIDRLPLGSLAELVGPHLVERFHDILAALEPAGELRHLHVQGGPDWLSEQQLQVEARLDDFTVQAWQGAPGVTGISGLLRGSPASGQLRLDSERWSMQLPRLFEATWHNDSLHGALNWRWQRDAGLALEARGLAAEGEAGQATVDLELVLPAERDQARMQLDVALRNSRAARYADYLPTRAPAFNERLGTWLAGTELDGEVPLALFSYRGSLRAGALPQERDIRLYAELRDGHLIAQPGWPAFDSVNGTLRLHNRQVAIEQGSATLWDSRVEDVSVAVGRTVAEQPMRIDVTGNVIGKVEDALRFLQQAPLGEQTAELVAGWEGAGTASGQMTLGLNLQQGAKPDLALDFTTQAAQLSVPALQTTLTDIAGAFSYQHGRGLTAPAVSLRLLGEPVQASIASKAMVHQLSAAGRHPMEKLRQWSLVPELPAEVAEGGFAWEAEMQLAAGEQSVTVQSNLVGLALDIPEPLGKRAETPLPARLSVIRSAAAQRWVAELGTDTSLLLERTSAGLAGELQHGLGPGSPPTAAGPGLGISARLEHFELAAWQRFLAQWPGQAAGSGSEGAVKAPPEARAALAVNRLNLVAERFAGFGLELDELRLQGQRSAQGDWQLQIQQADVEGHILLPDSASQPMVIALDRLRLPRAESVADDGSVLVEPLAPRDVLADIRPSQLRPVDFGVSRLSWGDDEVGALAFVLRPSADGAHLNDVALDLRGGLSLAGNLFWGETVSRSRFTGQIEAGNIGEVLRTWDYAPTLTSRKFAADVDLDWPGSPAYFALKRSTGLLALRARDGMLKSGEGSADALRVFGLLNFNALTRRLRLDFSYLFGRGTAYDTLSADLSLTNGVMHTRAPLVMEGPSAKVQLDGQIDLPQDHIDMGMLVTLPLTNNLPLAAIIAGAPHIGGVLFLADKILGDRVARFASVKYRISGDWQQPSVDFDRAFDDKPALEELP